MKRLSERRREKLVALTTALLLSRARETTQTGIEHGTTYG